MGWLQVVKWHSQKKMESGYEGVPERAGGSCAAGAVMLAKERQAWHLSSKGWDAHRGCSADRALSSCWRAIDIAEGGLAQVVEWRQQKQLLERAGPMRLRDTLAFISGTADSEAEDDFFRSDEDSGAASRRAHRSEADARHPEDARSGTGTPRGMDARPAEGVPRGARARRDTAALAAPQAERVEYDSGQVRERWGCIPQSKGWTLAWLLHC